MFAKSALCLAALAALSAVAGQSASAAVITVNANASDGMLYNGGGDGGIDLAQGDLDAGKRFGSQAREPLFAFLLPVVPFGETVTNATVKVWLKETSGDVTLFNVDLYAVRKNSTSPDIQGSDWGWGASPGVGTLIQDNYFTSGTSTGGYVPTSAGGNAALLGFVNTGYTAGNYLIIRLNPDSPEYPSAAFDALPDATYYRTLSSEFGGGSNVAQLTLTTTPIPEPATVFVLAGVAGILGLSRRRHV